MWVSGAKAAIFFVYFAQEALCACVTDALRRTFCVGCYQSAVCLSRLRQRPDI